MNCALSGRDVPMHFYVADCVFALVFGVELCLRIWVYGRQFYRGEDWRWNSFDACLVALSAVELMVSSLNLAFMRSLRIIRAVRVARIIRAVRFVRQLRLMIASIACCIPSLFWSTVLLAFVLYLFS